MNYNCNFDSPIMWPKVTKAPQRPQPTTSHWKRTPHVVQEMDIVRDDNRAGIFGFLPIMGAYEIMLMGVLVSLRLV